MKNDRPSFTAGFVAWARGVASAYPLVEPPLHDLAAKQLLPAPIAWAIPPPERRWARTAQRALRVLSGGLVDHLAMRSTAIDLALCDAVADGVRQVILLGAGLDARAYRLPALASATVFEVDHPSTQSFKRARCENLRVQAQKLVHVSVDFARDALDPALAAAGHESKQPTFWIWEGVTMYLPPEATRLTVEVMGARSAPGSGIAVTYMDSGVVTFPFPLQQLANASFRALGEPLLGKMTPDQMGALLRSAGFDVVRDEHSVDWEREFGGSSLTAFAYRGERLATAQKGA